MFTDVFDARAKYTGATMPRYKAQELKIQDVVVVECYINRFAHKEKVTPEKPSKGKNTSPRKKSNDEWQFWRTQYEIISISLLLSAPAPQKEEDSSDSSEEGDETDAVPKREFCY